MFNRGPVKGLSIKPVSDISAYPSDGELLQNSNLKALFFEVIVIKIFGSNNSISIGYSSKHGVCMVA